MRVERNRLANSQRSIRIIPPFLLCSGVNLFFLDPGFLASDHAACFDPAKVDIKTVFSIEK